MLKPSILLTHILKENKSFHEKLKRLGISEFLYFRGEVEILRVINLTKRYTELDISIEGTLKIKDPKNPPLPGEEAKRVKIFLTYNGLIGSIEVPHLFQRKECNKVFVNQLEVIREAGLKVD